MVRFLNMKYLDTITDEIIFSNPEFSKCNSYTPRKTVKIIIKNDKGNIALITNDVHNIYMLPGGGADSENLEQEANREAIEEIKYDLKNIQEFIRVKEFRNREAKEYETVCFTADANNFYDTDDRTDEEKKNNLRVEWLKPDEVSTLFAKQIKSLKEGQITFYNTAFNVYRDNAFWQEYIENILE